MAKSQKKTTKPKTTKGKKPDEPKQAEPAPAAAKRPNTTDADEENRKLFLNVHLPKIKQLRDRLATANSNLRNAYKTAKAEGSFTKTDFDTAIEMEDAEKEARAKARIARTLVIARYMGSAMGAQLDLFLEPDRTPAADRAFDEGKMAAMKGETAKPPYDPSTEQHRKFMEGYHSVSEQRVKEGIKPLSKKEQKAAAEKEAADDDKATKAQKAANQAQRAADEKAFESPPESLKQQTSGVPTSRAAFLKQQQELAKQQAQTEAQQEPEDDEEDDEEDSAFSKRA